MLNKPKSDADVINKEPKVLLIGYGWVGQFCGRYFKTADHVGSDNVIKDCDNYTVGFESGYDLGIIGVPTPMNSETGQCDTSIVEQVVDKYKNIVDNFMIKSTVEFGTTDRLAKKYNVNICMSPEYVGETLGHKLNEPKRDTFLIIGGKEKVARKVAEYWRLVLHADSKILLCSAIEAEIVKYCENYWIMRRVDYWNDVYDFCRHYDASFDRVREGLVLDPRLNRTHSFVYPNNRGWSGKCLPKDMNALAYTLRKTGLQVTLDHLIQKNVVRRKDYPNKQLLKPTGGKK